MKIMVTGGAGFIGSAVVRRILTETEHSVVNVDKLTYAGNLDSIGALQESSRYAFARVDICDRASLDQVFASHQPTVVLHLAAESHVDRSISGPGEFIQTNFVGTYQLLEAARSYYEKLSDNRKKQFRFHHVSTDEVFGDLGNTGLLFTEQTPYAPSSPYSASKAGSDHLVRAWGRTFSIPVVITNCSNNYGPYQFPEKLIPHVILNAIRGKPLPVYGDGQQVRDWLFVEDHAEALLAVLMRGDIGETYNIGGLNEKPNLDIVHEICTILEGIGVAKPDGIEKFADLITFVRDRPGHDVRYAIDASKIERDLGWRPRETFETGLRRTIHWYLENETWTARVLDGSYQEWVDSHYGDKE